MDHEHHHHHDHEPAYDVSTPGHHGDHHHHDVHGGHHQHSASHHQAYFNSDFNVIVLFENWVLDSKANVFLACLATCLLAVGYQGTKWLRQYLHSHYRDKIHSIKSKEHLIQTFMYAAEFLVSYVLMLVVMTYNIWIFIVAIVGTAVGYFLIAWHQKQPRACGGDECAEDCPNVVGARLSSYDQKPLEQELLPLSGRVIEVCEGCENKFDNFECKETDILT